MQRQNPRRGFTLVELLVVIAIIGTLVALLLPAVQSAREASRRTTCTNNQKNLATALINFDSSQKKLPGYVNDLIDPTSQKSQGFPTVGRQATWAVMLFPYIEENQLWDRWNNFQTTVGDSVDSPAGATPQLDLFICPSDEPESPGLPWSSYVVNAGWSFNDQARNGNMQEYVPNGVFFDVSKNVNIIPSSARDGREGERLIQCSIGYISSNDGASKTLMTSENLHSFFWTYPTPESQNKSLADGKHWFGFVWLNDLNSCPQRIGRVNGDNNYDVGGAPLLNMEDLNPCYAFPSSNHSGGVVIASFCDGRVDTINGSIDPTVYGQLMTSNSKKSTLVGQDGTPDRQLPPPSDDEY